MTESKPSHGFKAVINYGSFRWFILELDIPADATVVHSGGGFYRADSVIPKHFWPARTKTAIIDMSAHSWFNKEFDYTIGKVSATELDTNQNTDCAPGIHFFETIEQAKNWGNANFGINAAI